MLRPCDDDRLLVVINPGTCRPVVIQDHGFYVAQIDPGPCDRCAAGDIRLKIERAVRIAEADVATSPSGGGVAERLPVVRTGTADR